MPKITFTQENLLERKQLSAGWRKLKVKDIKEGPGKNDPESIVWTCVFIIDEGADLGVPVNHWFSEKQMGRLSEFIKCFVKGDITPGKEFELNDTIGRHVMGYCQYDPKQGWNVINDFKPVK